MRSEGHWRDAAIESRLIQAAETRAGSELPCLACELHANGWSRFRKDLKDLAFVKETIARRVAEERSFFAMLLIAGCMGALGYGFGRQANVEAALRSRHVPVAPFRYIGGYDLRHGASFDWTLADPNFSAFVHVVARDGIVLEYHSP